MRKCKGEGQPFLLHPVGRQTFCLNKIGVYQISRREGGMMGRHFGATGGNHNFELVVLSILLDGNSESGRDQAGGLL